MSRVARVWEIASATASALGLPALPQALWPDGPQSGEARAGDLQARMDADRSLRVAPTDAEARLVLVEEAAVACELAIAPPAQGGETRKRTMGAFHTPRAMVDEVVVRALAEAAPATRSGLTVLDPACGAGAFLRGVTRALLRVDGVALDGRALASSLYGVDVDLAAVVAARALCWLELGGHEPDWADADTAAILSSQIVHGDALWSDASHATLGDTALDMSAVFSQVFSQETPGFDLVVGNPPFVDSETMTRSLPEHRIAYASRYIAASGNWDLYCPFIERALELTRNGGFHAFVVPNALASAPYASFARRALADQNTLVWVRDYGQTRAFGAAVYPIAYLVHRTKSQGTPDGHRVRVERSGEPGQGVVARVPRRAFGQRGATWPMGLPMADWELDALARLDNLPRLGGWAEIYGAATVSEAYELERVLEDGPEPGPRCFRVVNSGTIDPFVSLWGLKPMQYLKKRYERPVVDLDQLPLRRTAQARKPKVIVAGLSRCVEAFADAAGAAVAAKSTTLLLPRAGVNTHFLAGWLNASPISWYLQRRLSGLAMRGGFLRLGPPQIREIPGPSIPLDGEQAAAAAQRIAYLAERLAQSISATLLGAKEPRIASLWRELDLHVGELLGLTEQQVDDIREVLIDVLSDAEQPAPQPAKTPA